MRPSPFSQSILFFLNRKATPLTLAATVSSLCFIMRTRSSLGGSTITPSAAIPCPASSNISEACSSAFDGMQPMLRHVPPSVSRYLDDGDFHAELRGADGADIAAGAGADDDDVVGHGRSFVKGSVEAKDVRRSIRPEIGVHDLVEGPGRGLRKAGFAELRLVAGDNELRLIGVSEALGGGRGCQAWIVRQMPFERRRCTTMLARQLEPRPPG